MRLIFSLLLLAVGISHAGAQAPRVTQIEIFDAGIYRAEVTRKIDAPEHASGQRNEITNIALVEKTTRIKAAPGVRFGFRYRIIGQPNGANVLLKKITRFPPQGIRNPQAGTTTFQNQTNFTGQLGTASYTGYNFDYDFELVPGIWTIELWSDDRKLASQSFTVTKP